MIVDLFKCFPGYVAISGHCNINKEASICILVHQSDIWPVVLNFLVSLYSKVPEVFCMLILQDLLWLMKIPPSVDFEAIFLT